MMTTPSNSTTAKILIPTLLAFSNTSRAVTIIDDFVDITLLSNHDYRLVFVGLGSELTGQIFDLTDLDTPLASLSLTDATLFSGLTGVLAAGSLGQLAASFEETGTAATFDNFTDVPEPGSAAFIALAGFLGFRRKRS